MKDEELWGAPILGTGDRTNSVVRDVLRLEGWVNLYYQKLGIVDAGDSIARPSLGAVLSGMQTILNRNIGNSATPSVFKRAAALTISFVARSPLSRTFEGGLLGGEILRIANHQNAVIAFEYCRTALERAKIHSGKNGEPVPLEKPIKVSVHFYCDLIHAIATTKCEPSEFHLLTLLYESLCYQENNVSYPRIA